MANKAGPVPRNGTLSVLPAQTTNRLEVVEMEIALIPILVFVVIVFIAGSLLVIHALYSLIFGLRRQGNRSRSSESQVRRHQYDLI